MFPKKFNLAILILSLISYLPNRESNLAYAGQRFVGPILQIFWTPSFHFAYEHGADCPNAFLEFVWKNSATPQIELVAVKGNYYDGQNVSEEAPFTSVWFQIGMGHWRCGRSLSPIHIE